jgi:hypothetical protein
VIAIEIDPWTSVRKTLAPRPAHRPTTAAAGKPNRLPSPQLMTAIDGEVASTNRCDDDVRLP